MQRRHRLRFFRNLLVIALLWLAIWSANHYPLPTAEMEFRRAERQVIAPKSSIIWSLPDEKGRRPAIAGLTPTAVHTYDGAFLTVWPRSQEGCTLVPLPRQHLYDSPDDLIFLLLDPPKEAASVRLTITMLYLDVDRGEWVEDYTVEVPLEERFTLLHFQQKYGDEREMTMFGFWANTSPNSLTGLNFPYTLEFFDANGKLLDTVTNQ